MWHYVKQALLPFLYLFFTAISAFGIVSINNDLIWLKVVLGIANLGVYAFIIGASSFKDGQEALKVRIANDLERVQIIKTGEDRPLRLREEYKAWKGFFIGFVACAPLIVLLLIHTILIFAVGEAFVGAGAVAGFIYMMYYMFALVDSTIQFSVFNYYWALFAIPIMMLITGIPYLLGARKIEIQQQAIKESHRQIYGE